MKYGCWQCHGMVGQGSAITGRRANPMPYDAMAAFIRSSNRAMPPYKEAVLPTPDLQDIRLSGVDPAER
jgi:ubiquinol-cytochrome c reductase cytochrome c subunit